MEQYTIFLVCCFAQPIKKLCVFVAIISLKLRTTVQTIISDSSAILCYCCCLSVVVVVWGGGGGGGVATVRIIAVLMEELY